MVAVLFGHCLVVFKLISIFYCTLYSESTVSSKKITAGRSIHGELSSCVNVTSRHVLANLGCRNRCELAEKCICNKDKCLTARWTAPLPQEHKTVNAYMKKESFSEHQFPAHQGSPELKAGWGGGATLHTFYCKHAHFSST